MIYTTLVTDEPKHIEEIEGEQVNKLCSAFNMVSRDEWMGDLAHLQGDKKLSDKEQLLLYRVRKRGDKYNHFRISITQQDKWEEVTTYSGRQIAQLLNKLKKKGIVSGKIHKGTEDNKTVYTFNIKLTPDLSWLQERDNLEHGKAIGRNKSDKQMGGADTATNTQEQRTHTQRQVQQTIDRDERVMNQNMEDWNKTQHSQQDVVALDLEP